MMQLLPGWFCVLVLYLQLSWCPSKLRTQRRFEKSWQMLWKPLAQLAGPNHASIVRFCTQLPHRFLVAAHKFYAEFYTRNGHHIVPIHDATALYTSILLLFFPCLFLIRLIMYYAIAPLDFQTEQLVVDVETEGTITTGTMVSEVYLYLMLQWV
jgi:hypothetical protein